MAHSWAVLGNTGGSTAGTTNSATTALNDCVVACVGYYSSTGVLTVTISDSKGNSYTGTQVYNQVVSGNYYIALFVLPGIQNYGSGHTFTVTLSTADYAAIWVEGFSGRATSNAIDTNGKTINVSGTSSSTYTGSTTPSSGNTQAGDDLLGFVWTDNNAAQTFSASGSWALSQQGPNGYPGATEYQNNVSASTYQAGFTSTASGKSGTITLALLAAAQTRFRKSLSPIGTRTGARQLQAT